MMENLLLLLVLLVSWHDPGWITAVLRGLARDIAWILLISLDEVGRRRHPLLLLYLFEELVTGIFIATCSL